MPDRSPLQQSPPITTDPSQLAQSAPTTADPIEDFGAVDYRENPNAGGVGSTNVHAASYDHPLTADDHPVEPWTDQTWAAYDAPTDASRFRGINSPEQQAQLHLSPQGVHDALGFSPDIAPALAFERSGPDGSPPS